MVESRGPRAENKPVTATFVNFRRLQALKDKLPVTRLGLTGAGKNQSFAGNILQPLPSQ
jgi:hypothetical protein